MKIVVGGTTTVVVVVAAVLGAAAAVVVVLVVVTAAVVKVVPVKTEHGVPLRTILAIFVRIPKQSSNPRTC